VAKQLISPLETAPPVPDQLTTEQRIALWVEVMDACDELLLAGLRRQVGSDEEVLRAYRHWYATQMEEHDRTLIRLLARLARAEANHDG
jgi:hypothetical protein